MIDLDYLIEQKLIINNEYLLKYQWLILQNKATKKEAFKTQIHHIIPKAVFKILNLTVDNSIKNTVNLAYKDHILAHYYLAQCSTGILKYSNIMAIKHIIGHKCCDISEQALIEMLPNIQALYTEAMQKQAIRTHNEKIGKKFTAEHKQKISEANRGRIYINNGIIDKIIKIEDFDKYKELGFVKGRLYKYSAEAKIKMSLASKGHTTSEKQKTLLREHWLGTKWMRKNNIIKQVKPAEIEQYLANGWEFGKKKG